MSDLIRREDAIGACAYETLECYEARNAIRNLPSADRPAKKWIKHSGDEWVVRVECPNCHRRFQFSPRLMWKCCPLCEIKMNGMVKRKGE